MLFKILLCLGINQKNFNNKSEVKLLSYYSLSEEIGLIIT